MISFLEGLFLCVCAINSLVPGRWAPKWYMDFVRPHSSTFFACHAPALGLVLYFCTGDNQWKYIPASILICLLYDFGFIWSAEWFTIPNLLAIAAHHGGPLLAFYFQTPEEAWLNCMLYFQVWWIHGFGFLRQTLMPALGLGEVEKHSSFDFWLHQVYAAVTPLAYLFYVQYLPFGWNYSSVAIVLQVSGRYFAAGNLAKFVWMHRLECPGLIAVASYSYGGFKLAIPTLLIYITTAYFFIEKPKAAGKGCDKLVLTDEIREFMKTFPDEESIPEDKKTQNAHWFDNQAWAEKYPFFRAVMLRENDKVAQMLKEGADHSVVLTDWWHSVPMQWACSGGGVSTMKILIEAGANPFYKGVRDGTYMFNQVHSRKFYDDLQALAKKDETLVSSVNVELLKSPVDYNAAQELAKSKGGRLVTSQEVELLLAHRAANGASEDTDVDDVTCFATTDLMTSTFTCKVTKGESTVIVGGEVCSEVSKCSLLMWIPQEEQIETEEKDKEAKVAA